MVRKKKLTPRRRRGKETPVEDELIEAADTVEDESDEEEPVEGDDCGVTAEDDELVEDEAVGGGLNCHDLADGETLVPIEENAGLALINSFGDIDGNEFESDDSGDDIWDDDKIPDPISSDDEEEEFERQNRQDEESADEILVLGKCFSSAAVSASSFSPLRLAWSKRIRRND